MKHISIILCVIIALAVFATDGFATKSYYVNSMIASDVGRNGLTTASAVKTISRAYELVLLDVCLNGEGTGTSREAKDDYEINIMGQKSDFGLTTFSDKYTPDVYTGEINVGFNNHPLTIQSYDKNYANWTILYTASPVAALFKVKASGVCFNRIRFQGGIAANVNAINIVMTGTGPNKMTVTNCVFNFEDASGAYKITGSAIDGGNNGEGIVKLLALTNNVFIGPPAKTATGVTVSDAVGTNLLAINNTFFRLGTAINVFSVGTAVLPASEIRNNIFLSCAKGIDVSRMNSGSLSFSNCLSYDFGTVTASGTTITPFVAAKTGIAVSYPDTLRRDPKIVSFDMLSNAVSGLASNSPCIDAGSFGLHVPPNDLFGSPPRTEVPDIGAVEYNGRAAQVTSVRWYVNPEYSGTDVNGSVAKPFKSLQEAYDAIPNGLVLQSYILNLIKGAKPAYSGLMVMNAEKKNFTEDNPLTVRSADITQKVLFRNSGTIMNLGYTKYVIIEGVNFEGSGVTLNHGIVGTSNALAGRAENIVIRQCKFTCDASNRLQPISGLGDGLLVENCIFFTNFTNPDYSGIDQGDGGLKYKLYNNTALNDWYCFVKMRSNTAVEAVNNLVVGIAAPSVANIKDGATIFALDKCGYYYGVLGANQTVKPQIDGDPNSASFCTPRVEASLTGLIVNAGYMLNGLRRDDYYGKIDGEGKRDIGAVEFAGYAVYDQTYYSLNKEGAIVAEISKTGKIKYTNIYGADGIIGKELYNAGTQYIKSVYYLKNHLGSTMKIVDNAGNSMDSLQYFDFGGAREYVSAGMAGLTAQETFTGKMQDNDGNGLGLGIQGKGIGFYYFGARFYDPDLCQWTSLDPDNSDFAAGFGPYTYCQNNPVNKIDPDGRLTEPTRPTQGKEESAGDYEKRKQEYEKQLAEYYKERNYQRDQTKKFLKGDLGGGQRGLDKLTQLTGASEARFSAMLGQGAPSSEKNGGDPFEKAAYIVNAVGLGLQQYASSAAIASTAGKMAAIGLTETGNTVLGGSLGVSASVVGSTGFAAGITGSGLRATSLAMRNDFQDAGMLIGITTVGYAVKTLFPDPIEGSLAKGMYGKIVAPFSP